MAGRTVLALAAFTLPFSVHAKRVCKITPSDPTWPSDYDWQTLNSSINGRLSKTIPAASPCWPGNPFGSQVSCDSVGTNWTSGIFHAARPESIDYPVWANNSCLPPGTPGYERGQGCELGGLPEYIVNATQEGHVATASKWASGRNIRVSVKGTGHDMNGRSSGAFSVSIWTRHFQKLEFHSNWTLGHHDVVVAGSSHGLGDLLTSAQKMGKVVCTGQDPSVGLGGWTQGGGHGPLSGTHGLGSFQVVQLTVVTVRGDVLVRSY
ncbi:hypothetical protein LTR17_006796 [Elasticomyces elasticus]|nr:hypothetical protein LTR17_006796 [Elasticomyces elasticus]